VLNCASSCKHVLLNYFPCNVTPPFANSRTLVSAAAALPGSGCRTCSCSLPVPTLLVKDEPAKREGCMPGRCHTEQTARVCQSNETSSVFLIGDRCIWIDDRLQIAAWLLDPVPKELEAMSNQASGALHLILFLMSSSSLSTGT
jgi:hypothetical protein